MANPIFETTARSLRTLDALITQAFGATKPEIRADRRSRGFPAPAALI
jgi:hypothetical protein